MTSSTVYQQKRALIIGINKYPRDPLNYCIYDAADLSTALRGIGFEVTLELDCHCNKFYQLIDSFAETVQRDDLVLFYFAGHGKQMEDQNYLLPSDYDYDYRRHESDYITNHAINVQYIMKKIDDKLCRVTIYIFDCCRKLIKTRAINMNQGLLPMNAPSKTLIVFACAPGKSVPDETGNDRNGIFIENLLKYITMPNNDIEDIMRNVACDVNLQTGGFQLPYRTSSLTERIFLITHKSQECHPTAWLKNILSDSTQSNGSSTDINILLLSEANSGKTTFINALANYLTYDTIDEALQEDIQVVKPFRFAISDPETYEDLEVAFDTPYKNLLYGNAKTSNTQVCQSYNFTIGNRVLRLIDTPSMWSDGKTLECIKHMEPIFMYISQYKYLNGVCILLKPDITRPYPWRWYWIKELLSYLHVSAHENIMWVFTHARNTHFVPGSTLILLRKSLKNTLNIDYTFTRQNCCLVENEDFRRLALYKRHREFASNLLFDYGKSWNHTANTLFDLISNILSCKPVPIREAVFLYIARQFTYKLTGLIKNKVSSQLSVNKASTDSVYWNIEEVLVRDVCIQLSQFIKSNVILPFNNDIYECYEFFKASHQPNSENIEFCKNMIDQLDYLKNLLTTNIDTKTSYSEVSTTDPVSHMNNILNSLDKICALPIYGMHIRQYIQTLELVQKNMTGQRENIVKLPTNAQSSTLMQKLRSLIHIKK